MSRDPLRCAVVGAANIDIGGFPAERLAMHDSNPGRVTLSAGGVGRNIACGLARLGVQTDLVTALGSDAFSDIVRADCRGAGVRPDLAFTFEGASSSVYLYIADADGDMQLAVNDMSVCDRLTPALLEGRVEALNAMDLVVLDSNLSREALSYLAQAIRVPLLADPVSAAKAPRLRDALPRLRAVKPNALEAQILTGIPVHDADSAAAAARSLVGQGVERAFVTLGERGVCCADAERTLFIPGAPVQLVNATGAGDAFTAALAWGELRGLSLEDCALAGLAAGQITAESLETVSPLLSESALLDRLSRVRRQCETRVVDIQHH